MTISNDTTIHKVFIQRIVPTEVERLRRYLLQVRDEALKAVARNRITKQHEKDIGKIFKSMTNEAMDRLQSFAEYEANFTSKLLNKYIQPPAKFPSQEIIKSTLERTNVGLTVDKKPHTIKRTYDIFSTNKTKQLVQTVKDSELQDDTIEVRTGKVDTLVNGLMLAQLATLVSSTLNATSEAMKQATYAENEEVVKYVRWVTMLDDSVCPDCEALHDEEWPVDAVDEEPPLHANCRCHLEPVL